MQISGLGSGIDTAGMVNQLMFYERKAGDHLVTGRSSTQARVSAFTSLNSKMKALADAATKFNPTSVLDTSVWKEATARSSNEALATVSAGSNAKPGNLTFTVQQLAQAHTLIGSEIYKGDAVVNDGKSFTLNVKVNDKTTTVEVAAGARLADVVAAINDQAGTGVQATMVQVANGEYKLQINSVNTGSANKVSITESGGSTNSVLGGFNEVYAAQDTILKVGSGVGSYEITSSTREVKDVLPGVSINPLKVDKEAPVTVSVGTDVEAMGDAVDAMVKAANEALSNIKINSGYNKERPELSGPFVGDSTTRALSYKIRDAVVGSSTLVPSVAGISVDRDGTVTFDREEFEAAYAKDADKVQATVNGVAERLAKVGTDASDSKTGTLTTRIESENSMIKDYGEQITRFNRRMELREQTLMAQFNAMESMLGKLQSQGNWLAGQLATLPTGGW